MRGRTPCGSVPRVLRVKGSVRRGHLGPLRPGASDLEVPGLEPSRACTFRAVAFRACRLCVSMFGALRLMVLKALQDAAMYRLMEPSTFRDLVFCVFSFSAAFQASASRSI